MQRCPAVEGLVVVPQSGRAWCGGFAGILELPVCRRVVKLKRGHLRPPAFDASGDGAGGRAGGRAGGEPSGAPERRGGAVTMGPPLLTKTVHPPRVAVPGPNFQFRPLERHQDRACPKSVEQGRSVNIRSQHISLSLPFGVCSRAVRACWGLVALCITGREGLSIAASLTVWWGLVLLCEFLVLQMLCRSRGLGPGSVLHRHAHGRDHMSFSASERVAWHKSQPSWALDYGICTRRVQ